MIMMPRLRCPAHTIRTTLPSVRHRLAMWTGGERMEAGESIKVATTAGVKEAITVRGARTALTMVLPHMLLQVLQLSPLSTPSIARRTGGGVRHRGEMARTHGEVPTRWRRAVLNEEVFGGRLQAPRRVALRARRAKLAGQTGAGSGMLSAAGAIALRLRPLLSRTGRTLVTGRLRLAPHRGPLGTAACDCVRLDARFRQVSQRRPVLMKSVVAHAPSRTMISGKTLAR